MSIRRDDADSVVFLPPFSLLLRFLIERSKFYDYCRPLFMIAVLDAITAVYLPALLCWL